MNGNEVYIGFMAIVAVVTAAATWYVAKHQAKSNQNHDYLDVIQALEINNKLLVSEKGDLKDQLNRITTHRDYLLAEQAALLTEFLKIKKNGGST